MQPTNKHGHYYKDVSKLQVIDVYRVLELFDVSNPCIQHAVKKLLVAGGRGAGKDITKDISEAIDSLRRWEQMVTEDKTFIDKPEPVKPKADQRHQNNPLANVTDEQLRKFYEVRQEQLNTAHNRIFDMLLGDDGQAFSEAERYLERENPKLWEKLISKGLLKSKG